MSALYDLNTDPYEVNNLIAPGQNREQYYEKLEELRVCLLEWLEKNNSKHYDGVNELLSKLTSVKDKSALPSEYQLEQNYPNPFNPTTTIHYHMPKAEQVKLDVYDIMGRKVATLVDKFMLAGKHQVEFDAAHLSSGVYYYRIQMGAFTDTKRLILQK